MTALLERDGFAAIGAGDAHRATEAFRDALTADPKNARLHLGAGIAAYLERRDGDARAALERALTIDPSLAPAREMLGQVLRRQGDLAGAIRVYDALIALKPDRADAAATLDRWRRELELHDRMLQAVGSQFTVAFEGPAETLIASRALESLNRAYWRIGAVLGTYPASPIAVVLYTNEQFRDITRAPTWSAAAYDGTIRVPMRGALEEVDELDRVLAHEFTHALVRTLASRGVPAWLNEGLATALEQENLSWAEARLREGDGAVTLRGLTGPRNRSVKWMALTPRSPTRRAPSRWAGCSRRRAASRSRICCATSARAPNWRRPSTGACPGRSGPSQHRCNRSRSGVRRSPPWRRRAHRAES